MSFASSTFVKGRGPLSVWRQCYVAECDILARGAGLASACEVELVVRDFFKSDEVEVDDLTVIVCYAREMRADREVGVYTVGVLLRGYPLNVPSEQLASWSPCVSSLVHKLTSSELIPSKSYVDVLGAFATIKDIFEEDESAVYVKQYFLSSLRKIVMSKLVFERDPVDTTFRPTRSWVDAEVLGTPSNLAVELKSKPRKRKNASSHESFVKKVKLNSTVSFAITLWNNSCAIVYF